MIRHAGVLPAFLKWSRRMSCGTPMQYICSRTVCRLRISGIFSDMSLSIQQKYMPKQIQKYGAENLNNLKFLLTTIFPIGTAIKIWWQCSWICVVTPESWLRNIMERVWSKVQALFLISWTVSIERQRVLCILYYFPLSFPSLSITTKGLRQSLNYISDPLFTLAINFFSKSIQKKSLISFLGRNSSPFFFCVLARE